MLSSKRNGGRGEEEMESNSQRKTTEGAMEIGKKKARENLGGFRGFGEQAGVPQREFGFNESEESAIHTSGQKYRV